MYTKDAIKEINPKYTYNNCLAILNKYDLFNKWLIKNININYKVKKNLNCYVSSCSIDFSYIFNMKDLIIKQNGKWLTYEQCMASMYMEVFERLSAIVSVDTKVLYSNKPIDNQKNPIIQKMIDDWTPIKKFYVKLYGIELNLSEEYHKYVRFRNLINNKYLNIQYIASNYNWSDWLNSWNTRNEAILWWIYEVIERYCIKAFFEGKKDVIVNKININSIWEKIPELKETIENICKHEKIWYYSLIEIKLKWTKIYTYIFFCKTTWKYANFWAWTHIIKRIAVIRAVSELVQVFFWWDFDYICKLGVNHNRWMNWGLYISDFISLNIIEKQIFELKKEKEYNEKNIDLISIDNLLKKTIQDLKKINIKYILACNITHKKIGIHSYIVKIPDFWLLWGLKYNSFFYEIKDDNENTIAIPYNINWINKMFFLMWKEKIRTLDFTNNYYLLLSFLYDYKLQEYITKNHNITFNKENIKKNDTLYSSYNYYNDNNRKKIEIKDPESFIYFRKILKIKNKSMKDFLYLFEVYCKIGWIDYGVYYIDENYKNYKDYNQFKEIYDKYVEQIHIIAKNNWENSNFHEANFLFKRLSLANQNVCKKWLD